MRNHNIFSILATIWVIANSLDPRPRKIWVNIEADNINADSAEASYHVANAIASALYEALLFVLANPRDNHAVSTLDVEVRAEASTHTATLTRTVFPMGTAAETGPESAAICAYSREVERYIGRCMNAIRADTAEMLKSLVAAHFDDTAGGEGNGYVISRRSATTEP